MRRLSIVSNKELIQSISTEELNTIHGGEKISFSGPGYYGMLESYVDISEDGSTVSSYNKSYINQRGGSNYSYINQSNSANVYS